MDPDSLTEFSNKPRKVKFQPKGPPRRDQKPLVLPKVEKVEDDFDPANEQKLLRRFKEASENKGYVKKEREVAPSMVAFGHGSSSSLKSYKSFKGNDSFPDGDGMEQKVEKDYKEPWDYSTNYPITLPLRPPHSGNPELLDQQEFGQASESLKYDENAINSAIDLGLMEENPEPSLLFFQLPADMPMFKPPSATLEGNARAGSSKTSKSSATSQQNACPLNELPAGFMGKLLVYKSGAVKLKLGDTLYDVSAGMESLMAQDVVAVNTEGKHCAVVGRLKKRVTVTPDVDSILDSILNE